MTRFHLLRTLFVLFFLFFLPHAQVHAQNKARVAVGASQSLILDEKGDVYTFGTGIYGELGLGGENRMDLAQAITHPTLAGKTIVDASIGMTHLLVLTSEGEIYGWNYPSNNYALGASNLNVNSLESPVLISEAALDTATIVNVYAGDRFSMFLSEAGTLFVVGNNQNGYLGINSTQNPITTPTPMDRTNLAGEKIVNVSISRSHAILITESNKVFGVGRNSNGELGTGNFSTALIPVEIPAQHFSNKTIVESSVSESLSMFLASDGTLFTCGFRNGGLGLGPLDADVTMPTIATVGLQGKAIGSIASLSQINANANIAIATDGSVFVSGDVGQILNRHGLINDEYSFVQVPPSQFNNKPIVAAAVGNRMSLFQASDGTLFGAGNNAGTGYNSDTKGVLPLDMTYLEGKSITKLLTTVVGAALISSDGTLFWFIADKTATQSLGSTAFPIPRNYRMVKDTPTKLTQSNLIGHTITDVKAGGRTSYLLSSEGKVFSFGNGQYGTLGNGDSLDVDVPTLLTHPNLDGKRIIDIVVSSNANASNMNTSHALLLADDGTLFGMGRNTFGQLGVGDTLPRFVPTPVTTNLAGKTIIKIAVGGENSMAIASDGSVFLWGKGGNGEMGFGNSNSLLVPTLATHTNVGGKKVIDGAIGSVLVSGNNLPHFLVLNEDRTLYSFGNNIDGQLGLGYKNTVVVTTPTAVLDTMLTGETIVAVQAGLQTSLLLTQSGKLFGWGQAQKLGFSVSVITDYVEPRAMESNDLDGRKVIDVRSHGNHGLALYDDGTVLSFGNYNSAENFGVLGNGPTSGDGTLHSHYSGQKLPTIIANFTTYHSPIPTGNLALHLDAERMGFIRTGNLVNTWQNLANDDHHAVNPAPELRPTLVDSAINNRPAMRFNGSDQYFVLPTTSNLGIQNNDYELFMVAQTASSNTNLTFLLSAAIEQIELHANGGIGARYIPNAGNYVDAGSTGNFTNGAPHLYNLRASDTEGVLAMNRGIVSVYAGNARTSTGNAIPMGVRQGGSFYLNGDIAEVIIYNKVLSPTERDSVEKHLFRKYAIQNYKEESTNLTGTEGWRLLSTPVADSTYASFFRGLWTQGFTGASAAHGSPNVYTWPTAGSGTNANQWLALSNANTAFQPGTGVLMYVFSDDDGPGNENDAGFPKTLPAHGFSPNTDVVLTSRLNANNEGWSLLGNPYTSNVDWDLMTKSGLSGSVYVWDNSTSQWRSWNGSVGGLTDGIIGPFNGFFVETLEEDPSLTIPLSAKVDGTSAFLGKTSEAARPFIELELSHHQGKSNKTWFEFSHQGKEGKDPLDALKLAPLSEDFVQIASGDINGRHLDINQLPLEFNRLDVPVHIQSTYSGEHVLRFSKVTLPQQWSVYVQDAETGQRIGIDEELTFTSTPPQRKSLTANDRPEITSQNSGMARFTVIVMSDGTETERELPSTIELSQNYPNPFNPSTTIQFGLPQTGQVRLEIFDINGRKVAQLINETRQAGYYQVTFNASRLASGMYFYRLSGSQGVVTKKMMLVK